MSCYYRVMLINALRTSVNNQFLKKFDTTFMKNKKKIILRYWLTIHFKKNFNTTFMKKILIFFSLFHNFFKK